MERYRSVASKFAGRWCSSWLGVPPSKLRCARSFWSRSPALVQVCEVVCSDRPAARQVLGGETALYIATDSDNRTALEPIIKAFPQVWCPAHGEYWLRSSRRI